MKRLKNYIIGAAALLYAFFLVVFIKDVGEAAAKSVQVCLEVMIPSLYAFMVISGFIVSSGLYAVISKPFGAISRYVFRIPEEYFSVFLIGSIGGYPVGAKLLASLYQDGKIDRHTAETMLSYCYLAGPAFICSIAGVRLFSSLKAGMVIFISSLCANIILGFIRGLGRKIPPRSNKKIKLDMSMERFIDSIYNGAKGMMSICAIIIFFSTLICILDKLNVIKTISAAISGSTYLNYTDSIAAVRSFIEISNITLFSPENIRLMPVITALLSFGGVCVTLQAKGFVSGILSTKCFYLYRISAAIISYFLCKMFIIVFNMDLVYTISSERYVYRHNSPILSLFLLIMTILLLLNISIAKRKNL